MQSEDRKSKSSQQFRLLVNEPSTHGYNSGTTDKLLADLDQLSSGIETLLADQPSSGAASTEMLMPQAKQPSTSTKTSPVMLVSGGDRPKSTSDIDLGSEIVVQLNGQLSTSGLLLPLADQLPSTHSRCPSSANVRPRSPRPSTPLPVQSDRGECGPPVQDYATLMREFRVFFVKLPTGIVHPALVRDGETCVCDCHCCKHLILSCMDQITRLYVPVLMANIRHALLFLSPTIHLTGESLR